MDMDNQCLHRDCINKDKKCSYCFDGEVNYLPAKIKAPKSKFKNTKDKRQGSKFEYENHKQNNALLTQSNMTPNSGAGSKYKGDEQISGLVNIMEELKTATARTTNGNKSFAIKREWLEKLDREALIENKEFYYLKFRFHEDDKHTYCVIDSDILMSMVYTLKTDREISALAQSKIDLANKQFRAEQAKNVYLSAELQKLNAELKLFKQERSD